MSGMRGQLGTFREAYDELRQAQEFVMTGEHQWTASRSNYLDDRHASDCAISNLDTIFPDWRDKSTRLIILSGEEPDPRPWPLGPIEQFVWFSSSDAQVWIPTRRQLDQLHADRQRRRNPMPAKKPKSKYPKQIHGETMQRAPWVAECPRTLQERPARRIDGTCAEPPPTPRGGSPSPGSPVCRNVL